jgi:hypothetical protein
VAVRRLAAGRAVEDAFPGQAVEPLDRHAVSSGSDPHVVFCGKSDDRPGEAALTASSSDTTDVRTTLTAKTGPGPSPTRVTARSATDVTP